jgi:hypothetical protein
VAGLRRQDRDDDLGDHQRERRCGGKGYRVNLHHPADPAQPPAAPGQHPCHRDRQQCAAPACSPACAQRHPDRGALTIGRQFPGYEHLKVAG